MQITTSTPDNDLVVALADTFQLIKSIPILQKKIEELELKVAKLDTAKPAKAYYTLTEAAEFLSTSPKTVRRLIERRILERSYGIRHIRIPAESLKSYWRITGPVG